jgi:hypothetical protein
MHLADHLYCNFTDDTNFESRLDKVRPLSAEIMKIGGSSHQKTLECDSACDSAWCKLQFDSGNVLSVYGAAFTIGRLQSNHLVVEDARLSGTHCCLAPAAASGKPPILTDTSTTVPSWREKSFTNLRSNFNGASTSRLSRAIRISVSS